MYRDDAILLGMADTAQHLWLRHACRHGLIAGAGGTGRTASLQVLAEGFAAHGVPVFVADVRGDVSGISQPGALGPGIAARAERVGRRWTPAGCPTVFWDLFGEAGHPIRATVSELGPLLLARLLGLNPTQEAVLALAFGIADEERLLLLDCRDLRALLHLIGARAPELALRYGRLSTASVGAIQRRLTTLEQQGGRDFFGEPALAVEDLLGRDDGGLGVVNVLDARRLMGVRRLYAGFLLWLLAELLERLPEAGDGQRPRLVFFVDEAQLLFDGAPNGLPGTVEAMLGGLRAKGVGVFLLTDGAGDLPQAVLAQLGHRVQHAPVAGVELGVGEALVSTPGDGGVPSAPGRTLIAPPASRLGPATPAERRAALAASPLAGRYERALGRESAYEALARRAERDLAAGPGRRARSRDLGGGGLLGDGPGRRIGRAIRRGPLGTLCRG